MRKRLNLAAGTAGAGTFVASEAESGPDGRASAPVSLGERSRVRFPVYAHVGRCRCLLAWGVMGALTRY
ncbi:unnamed protein product [Closterium sp. NIES-54]